MNHKARKEHIYQSIETGQSLSWKKSLVIEWSSPTLTFSDNS